MSGSEDKVKVEIDSDGIAWVTLNEPEVRNALSPELRAQFVERIPPRLFSSAFPSLSCPPHACGHRSFLPSLMGVSLSL